VIVNNPAEVLLDGFHSFTSVIFRGYQKVMVGSLTRSTPVSSGERAGLPDISNYNIKKEWNDLSLIMLYQIWVLYAITLHSSRLPASISTRVLLVHLIGKVRLVLISTPLVVMRAKRGDEVRSSTLLGSATCDEAADLLLNRGRGEVLKSRSCLAVWLLRDGIERLLLPHG
jgi:hypothetical protein